MDAVGLLGDVVGLLGVVAGQLGGVAGPLGNGKAVAVRVLFSATGLRNRRFLRVTLPEPSTLIRYWRWGSTSTTRPDLSHLPLVWIITDV